MKIHMRLSARGIVCPICGALIGQNCLSLKGSRPLYAIIKDRITRDSRAGFRGTKSSRKAHRERLDALAQKTVNQAHARYGINGVQLLEIDHFANRIEVKYHVE